MNNLSIKIRRAVESDYENINSLYFSNYSEYAKYIPDSYREPPQKTLPKGTYLNMIDDKQALVVVAENGNEFAGMLYATIEKADGDEWTLLYHRVSIDEIAVLPQYENHGIGTKLMQEAESWAKTKGIKDLIVLVYDFNKKAISFYEKNDYKPYSIQMKKKI